jgi:hypothetical protein
MEAMMQYLRPPRYRATLWALACVAMMGCVKPYLKVTDKRAALKASPTLVTSAVFDNTRRAGLDNKSVLDVALKVVSNVNLDDVGEQMVADAQAMLAEYGLVLKQDKAQASAIDFFKGEGVTAINKVAQILVGRWVLPNGAQARSITDQTWLFESVRVGMASKLDSKVPNEHFLFVSARCEADREWLIFVRPEVVLYYLVLNEKGHVVLEARGIGHGDKSLFSEDQTPNNLKMALKNASKNMKAQPVENLK